MRMHRSSPLSVLLVLLASLALGCAPGADVGELEDTLKSDAPLTVDATKLVAVADTNRDGVVDNGDRNGRGAFDWSRGAFVLPNIDDDDSNGKSDAEDDVSTGADRDDLATIRVALGSSVLGSAKNVSVKSLGGGGYARVYSIDGGAATVVNGFVPAKANLEFGVEAKRFAAGDWNGRITYEFSALDQNGVAIAKDVVVLRVAPMLLLPSSATPTAIHVATGAYSNAGFIADLKAAAGRAGTTVKTPYVTSKWQEMWMQDTLEIGYAQLPGRSPMHVALRANRGADSYAAKLRGPNMGYLVVGAPRSTLGGDAWVDWYGNLEVSPPTPAWPLGRVYYGHNTSTGMKLHPDVVAFFEAQEVQKPFWIDTSWLTIKHVDEILTFVPGANGKPKMLVASPREAGKLYPAYYGQYNKGIQAKIDKSLDGGSYVVGGKTIAYEGVLAAVGLTRADIVELPLLYTNGHNDWSNPINGVYLGGGRYAAGKTDYLAPERDVTTSRLATLGLTIEWIEDAVYQHNLGNVHCATNATRTPVIEDFTDALPLGN
jgi:protein-arginine deiminase